MALTGILVLLTLNKQLDLQTHLTDFGRRMARRDGWYADRRKFQLELVIGFALTTFLSLVVAVRLLRHWPRSYHVAVFGLAIYSLFVLMRLASFSHVDWLLALRMNNIKISRFIEPLGPTIILFTSVVASRHHRDNVVPPPPPKKEPITSILG